MLVLMVVLFSAEQPVWRVNLDSCTEQRVCAFQADSGRDRAVDRHMPSQRGPGGCQHVSGRAVRLRASPAPGAVPERPVLCFGRGLQILALDPTCRCPATRARNRQRSALPQRHARNGPLVLLPGKMEIAACSQGCCFFFFGGIKIHKVVFLPCQVAKIGVNGQKMASNGSKWHTSAKNGIKWPKI